MLELEKLLSSLLRFNGFSKIVNKLRGFLIFLRNMNPCTTLYYIIKNVFDLKVLDLSQQIVDN